MPSHRPFSEQGGGSGNPDGTGFTGGNSGADTDGTRPNPGGFGGGGGGGGNTSPPNVMMGGSGGESPMTLRQTGDSHSLHYMRPNLQLGKLSSWCV